MAGFRSLWRSERNKVPDQGVNGRKHPEQESARAAADVQGGDDFRYGPERRRHRYPEGLYSGVSRDAEPALRRNLRDTDREPSKTRPRPDVAGERTAFEVHPRHPRASFRRPDYEETERDREPPEDEESEVLSRPGKPPEEALPSGPHRGRGPRGYTRSDERIREDVCDRLTDDPEIDASDIEVVVANGEVTLNGSVDSRLIRRLAEDLADAVTGVSLVQNNLKIGARG